MGIATIMDLIRPEERELQRQQSLMNPGPYGINPLTQESYDRSPPPQGWMDFLMNPTALGTPLGNLWSQLGQGPTAEGIIPWLTGIGQEDVPGLTPAGRMAGAGFNSIYGPEAAWKNSGLMQPATERTAGHGRLRGSPGFAGSFFGDKGFIGGPLEAGRQGVERVGEAAGNIWDALGRWAWGEDWGQEEAAAGGAKAGATPPPMTDEAAKGAVRQFLDLGAPPQFGAFPEYGGSQGPDFTQAINALGTGPERPGQRPLSERLGRVLGGGAAGAAQAVQGTTGGHSVAMALAGAAGGSGAAVARISREEQTREDRWKAMSQRHKESLAGLRAQAENAKTAHAQREAMAKYSSAAAKAQAERQEEMLKAPEVIRTGAGTFVVKTYNEKTGRFEGQPIDMLETWRNREWQAKMAAAQKDGYTWFGGDLQVKGVPAHLAQGAEIAMTRLFMEPGFRDRVIEFMSESMDIEELVAQTLQPGGLDWKVVEPMITFSAMRMMGYETSQMMAEYAKAQGLDQ